MGFTATVLQYDPYRKFKFLVKWDDTYVAGVSKLTGLSRAIEVVDWRTGGDANFLAKLPGLTTYEPLSLERGMSHDTTFMNWMRLVNTYQAAGGTDAESFHNFRKDMLIEIYNLVSEKVLAIEVFKCWPSKVVLGEWDATANELAIETLELQHEGWKVSDGGRPQMEAER
ncbi:MAG: phage tail protein [Proteobacteria bacterium]|nr:phage tail protein [Pseudomonadota bacterium]